MHATFIMPPEPITAAWLTQVLQQAGILHADQSITEIQLRKDDAFNSHVHFIQALYSDDGAGQVVKRFVLKQNIKAAWGVKAGIVEATFYQHIGSLQDHPEIIVPCYAAAYDEFSRRSYILTLDVSETHKAPITRAQTIAGSRRDDDQDVPADGFISGALRSLAQLHAYWWEHHLLGSSIKFEEETWSQEGFARYVARRTRSWQQFAEQEREWVPTKTYELYEELIEHFPPFWERYIQERLQGRRQVTATHNDAYLSNFLSPQDPKTQPTYILDWQSPMVYHGGTDLANMCATFWNRGQRQRGEHELKILRHYHELLQRYGVQGYSWDDLTRDYRLGIIEWVLVPLQDRYDGSARDYWWPKMQCLVEAFQDWHCMDLLRS